MSKKSTETKSSLLVEGKNTTAPLPSGVVVHNGKKAKFVVPATFVEGKDYLAEELVENQEMIERFFDTWIAGGILKEIF